MRTAAKYMALAVLLVGAVLLVWVSRSVTDSGVGNGAAVEWDDRFEAFADELVRECASDKEKVLLFREWIIENVAYDYDSPALFYQTFDANAVLANRKGVCFDYACLFAAFCRSQNIPCYVLDGTLRSDTTFRHAWNRVYFDGQWWSLDTTRDRTARENGETEYGIQLIGEDPFSEDRYFIVHQVF